MIKVTIMLWFELSDGEPRFKCWDTFIQHGEGQVTAEALATKCTKGMCKIFDKQDRVIGSAGF